MACGRHSMVFLLAVLFLAATTATAAAPRATDQDAGPRLLDVPYLPQTEDLCGGAALAMVLRYWGERQVFPEDFARLVDRSAAGIRTDVLAAEATRLGWQSLPIAADSGATGEWIQGHLDRGRPILALIEVRPNRYHYVVIVAWTAERVVLHDPARAPFQLMPRAEFDRAWAAARRWALLLLPRHSPASTTPNLVSAPASPAGACAPLVGNMVDLARTDLAAAEAGLLVATELCPRDPAAWRELAGVRFRQTRWAEAGELAERAAQLDPDDEQGWNLLGTSRFLNNEPGAALRAWNRIGRPPIDLVQVKGLGRTRQPVVIGLVDLPSRGLLTPSRLERAARRLQALPSAANTRLSYRPLANGPAEIEAVVVERPLVPRGLAALAATAARSWLQRELRVDVAAPTGSGELVTVAWRWWEARPRVAAALAVPAIAWLPCVTTIEGSWERSSYATPVVTREARRRAGIAVADWATGALHWRTGVAMDRWDERSHVSADAALDWRLANDRVSIAIDVAGWLPFAAAARFGSVGVSSAWRSTRDSAQAGWTISSGFTAATEAAPLDLWPGAGTGHARAPLLRAHPLLDHGVVSGPAFGRRLAHTSIEYQYPLLSTPVGTLRLAAFADAATAWRRLLHDDRGPWHTDAGAGIRLTLPGNGGTLRADLARGLRDGRVVFSSGWEPGWPR